MNAKFQYTDITSKGRKGWINLFFGGHCITLIKDVDLVENIKAQIPKLPLYTSAEDICPVCMGEGFKINVNIPTILCGMCGKKYAIFEDVELDLRNHRTSTDDSRRVTVCASCLRACCWQGSFMCDLAITSSTVDKKLSELESLGLESPHYWHEDPNN